MSIHILVLNDATKEVWAIADKRTMSAISKPNGDLFDWKHINDDAEKLHQITDDVYCATGGITRIGERILKELSKVKHLKPSELIDYTRKIDRTISPPFGKHPMDCISLFGMYDDGTLFEWLAERDGSEYMRRPDPGKVYMSALGAAEGVQEKLGQYIMSIHNVTSTRQMLVKAIEYASMIDPDKSVSPKYDLIHKKFKS